MPTSEFPDGAPNVYNIVQRELVFRSVQKSDIDPRYVLRSGGKNSHHIWSSFNLLPRGEQPVFVGVADTPAIITQGQTGQAIHEGVSVAVHGTRTLTIGPEPAHLGDQLFWDFPWVLQNGDNVQTKRPGLDQTGVPNDKFVAWLRPMSFDDFGSCNMFRNVASFFLGTFNPDPHQNRIFNEYRNLEMLLRMIADGDNIDVGVRTDGGIRMREGARKRVTDICNMLSELVKRPAEDLLREHDNLFKVVAEETMMLDKVDKTRGVNKGSVVRLILLQLEHNRQQHINFFLQRRVGMALSSGVNGPIDVYVRGGAAY